MKKIKTEIIVETKIGKKYIIKEIVIPIPNFVRLIEQGYVPRSKIRWRINYLNYLLKKGKFKCSIDIKKSEIRLKLAKPKTKLEHLLIKGGKDIV